MSQDALELLLTGVKDQAQRKQITTAYYTFANGDPETFAVQFAVLLRAHSMSLKLLPARLEKALAAETRRMSDLVIAHQNAIGRMASLIDQAAEKHGVGEGTEVCVKAQQAIEHQLSAHAEILAKETEKITSAVTANGRLTQRLAAHRILLTVILSYIGGVLTTLLFQELLSFVEPMLH
ncbi:MAG: hypothetical protein JO025_03405 [Verrucomicrobia bacterium]|nr:hypothetical protein [Verrucomicrobiota bacterium]